MLIEEKFAKMDEVIKKLEDENISLQESFSSYEEGMKLIKECNEIIDKVEKDIIVLEQNEE